ncbi:hypothetical protein H0W91_00970 [Patescibacteria group bacterium]|nr:hypothetical protein [Patescibacteria group bacterium]
MTAITSLTPAISSELTISQYRDPSRFYRTREGLYVRDSFLQLAVANTHPTEMGTIVKLNSTQITQDMRDYEIRKMLPTQHVFDKSQALAVIEELITLQWNGEEGLLVTKGDVVNLFFIDSCPITVMWCPSKPWWGLVAWAPYLISQSGTRVFYPGD